MRGRWYEREGGEREVVEGKGGRVRGRWCEGEREGERKVV